MAGGIPSHFYQSLDDDSERFATPSLSQKLLGGRFRDFVDSRGRIRHGTAYQLFETKTLQPSENGIFFFVVGIVVIVGFFCYAKSYTRI